MRSLLILLQITDTIEEKKTVADLKLMAKKEAEEKLVCFLSFLYIYIRANYSNYYLNFLRTLLLFLIRQGIFFPQMYNLELFLFQTGKCILIHVYICSYRLLNLEHQDLKQWAIFLVLQQVLALQPLVLAVMMLVNHRLVFMYLKQLSNWQSSQSFL